eukprot:scaffold192929_cov40-Tisochrysis_lutea.AAC.1
MSPMTMRAPLTLSYFARDWALGFGRSRARQLRQLTTQARQAPPINYARTLHLRKTCITPRRHR